MIVRYRADAMDDLNRIHDYLHERSPTGALNVMRATLAGVQVIAQLPRAGETTDDANIRVKVVTRYRYKIFYAIGADGVEILHIRHTSRRPWP